MKCALHEVGGRTLLARTPPSPTGRTIDALVQQREQQVLHRHVLLVHVGVLSSSVSTNS